MRNAVYTFVALVGMFCALASSGCAEAKDPANWSNTTRAAAAASLDFATCAEASLSTLAAGGAEAFTKDALISAAETCGIASVWDGFAIFVGVVRDVAGIVKLHRAAPSSPPTTPPIEEGKTP